MKPLFYQVNVKFSLPCDKVISATLRAHELTPGTYRKCFSSVRNSPSQTFAEFTTEKGTLLDRWCLPSKASDFNSVGVGFVTGSQARTLEEIDLVDPVLAPSAVISSNPNKAKASAWPR